MLSRRQFRRPRRQTMAATIQAYFSLSYKITDEATGQSQLLTRLVLPLPLFIAGWLYLIFQACDAAAAASASPGRLTPGPARLPAPALLAVVGGLWAALADWLYLQYVIFFVWLGAQPPSGYEYLLNRQSYAL